MRPSLLTALIFAASTVNAQECTTTTTTSTHCTGTAAPLAAPAPETPAPAPVVLPTPNYWAPQPMPQPQPWAPQVKARVELRPRYGMLAAGASIFGASYLLNASIAYMANEGTLAVPLIGPLLLASKVNDGRGGDDRAFTMLMVFDALVQTTGLVLFIAGAATKKKVTVWERVAVVPSASPSSAGVAAMGSF